MKLAFVGKKIIRPNLALIPVDTYGDEELARAKVGEELHIEATNFLGPTSQQLRYFFALVKKLYDNDRREHYPSRESCRHFLHSAAVQGDTRMADVRISRRTGSPIVYLKSLKDLKRDEMSDLIARAEQVVADEMGVDVSVIQLEAMRMVGRAPD